MSEENLAISKIFRETASHFAQKTALQIKKEGSWQRFTYQEIDSLSLKIGAFLIKNGFQKSESCALILENRPEWGIIYLGIMQAGLKAVPIDIQLTPLEIKNLLLDSQAKVIFSSHNLFTQKIKGIIAGSSIKAVTLDGQDNNESINFSEIEHNSADSIAWPDVLPQDIASLIYTSGTTARPKGVLLSHKNICSNFASIQKLNLCFPSDNALSILPLHHSYAFMVTLIVPLFLGGKVTYCASFRPQDLSQIIQEAKVTVLVGVPQLFSLIHRSISERIEKIPFLLQPLALPFIKTKLHRQWKSLRLMASGGARLNPKTARFFSRLGFRLVEGYGLTETSPVVTFNHPKKVKFGSVGKPIPNVEIKISQPDKEGIGEVLIKGPNVLSGYFKQPDLTAQRIKDGWFSSGDFGYIDKDGYLYLTGRQEEVIVLSSGKNIYPEELEEHYLKSPYVKEICILPKQEESFGSLKESLFAVIVPNLDFFRLNKEANIREKIRWELENLAQGEPSYKHIMGFALSNEELPRTALKKIKRYLVKQKYLKEETDVSPRVDEASSDIEHISLKDDVAKKIIQYIAGQVKKPVSLHSHLEIDLGIDSLTRVELGLGLETLLKVKIPDDSLYNLQTIEDVIVMAKDLLGAARVAVPEREIAQKNWSEILRDTSKEATFEKIKINFGILDKLITWCFQCIFGFIIRAFWFLRIEGRGNLPKQGPYLICPNHASYLDGLFILSSLPFKISVQTYFLGYSQVFEQPWIKWGVKIARLVSIDTTTHLTEAMQAVAFILSQQKIVCIFPEGRRSVDTSIQEFKKGVGILIKELDIPVVPVYLKGSHYAWPRTSLFPRFYPVKVIIGEPLSLKELIEMAKEKRESPVDSYEAISRQLREVVLKLC